MNPHRDNCRDNCSESLIPAKVLDEVDVFLWDFDLTLTRFHTICRNGRVIDRKSDESLAPLMPHCFKDFESEWFATKWFLNPRYFIDVVKSLVDVHGKRVGICTHHSPVYFQLGGGLDQGSQMVAGKDFVLSYLQTVFKTFGEDSSRYFNPVNVIALDCINHPGKMTHVMDALRGMGFVDNQSGKIVDRLVSDVKPNGNRYLRVALFDDDPQNLHGLNRDVHQYVSDLGESDGGSYDDSIGSSLGSYSGNVRIRGVNVLTCRSGVYCDEELWLRGFLGFPESAIEYGRAGFTSGVLNQLKNMLELEEIESSSSGEFVDDGYDSHEDL